MYFDPSSPHSPPAQPVFERAMRFDSVPPSPGSSPSPTGSMAPYVAPWMADGAPPAPLAAVQEGSDEAIGKAIFDQRAYDYALRDAAARFEETRRLASELASLQHALHQSRAAHEADMARASECEALLIAQLEEAQDNARSTASQEAIELGARAQVATWRSAQSQRQAEEAEAERRATLEELTAAQSELAKVKGELHAERQARTLAQERVRESGAREADLVRRLQMERDERRSEVARMKEASETAVSEAISDALTSRHEASEVRMHDQHHCSDPR